MMALCRVVTSVAVVTLVSNASTRVSRVCVVLRKDSTRTYKQTHRGLNYRCLNNYLVIFNIVDIDL